MCLKFESKGVLHQVLATCTINIVNYAHGAALGWVSPFLPLLQSEDSPLESGPVTVEQGSWIGSILCLGGLFGAIAYGYLTEKIGVKKSIASLCISNMSFWTIVYFGTSVYHLYLARFLAGVTGGGVIVTFPLFIADISDSKLVNYSTKLRIVTNIFNSHRVRGALGSILALAGNSGILTMYIVGDLLSYRTVPVVMISLPTLFAILMTLIPETPQSLLKQRNVAQAEQSLKFYSGLKSDQECTPEFKQQFEKLRNFILNSKLQSDRLQLQDFTSPAAKKGILIGIFLMFLNQFCGVFAILTYAVSIFSESGSTLSPGTSAIIMGAIQIVGTIASFIFIDLAGRKVLLLISTYGTGLGLTCLGVYSWMRSQSVDLTGLDWIPIASLSLTVFLFCVGLCNIPFFVLPELLPAKICNAGNTISMISITIFSFISLKILPILLEQIQLHGAVAIFASTCFIGGIVIALFIPETKGKNLVSPENV
ncbi:facilitated trehalose transporter Tret1-like isoform X1 [Culex pipiens pallens]|uniref:facilitated trehalose transporter Tret1-like isoform X1 n=1 Tax=Culex pipiens pallens TaxID=42434 RepID=UPI001954DCE4|nr:facilitated trehalose transporter Tret1-like isoform X1 [Culex pipiens pallens]